MIGVVPSDSIICVADESLLYCKHCFQIVVLISVHH